MPGVKAAVAPSTSAATFCPALLNTKSSLKFSVLALVVLTWTLTVYGEYGEGVTDGVACVGEPDTVADADGVTDACTPICSVGATVADGDGVSVGVGPCVGVGDGGTSTTGILWTTSPVSVYVPIALPRPLMNVTVAPAALAPSAVPRGVLPVMYG